MKEWLQISSLIQVEKEMKTKKKQDSTSTTTTTTMNWTSGIHELKWGLNDDAHKTHITDNGAVRSI